MITVLYILINIWLIIIYILRILFIYHALWKKAKDPEDAKAQAEEEKEKTKA